MKKPVLSIVVPVYNATDRVASLIERILAQPFSDFELVLIDDGSTDRTPDIIHAFSDSRLRVFTQPNRGASAARNTGLKQVRGHYVMFVDDDDHFSPDFFTRMVQAIQKDKTDLVTCGIRFQNLVTHTIAELGVTPVPKPPRNPNAFRAWIVRLLSLDGRLYNPCNKIFRADLIRKHRLRFDPDLDFGEDLTFNLDYLAHCRKISFLYQPLYIYNFDPRKSLFGRSSLVYQNRQTNYAALERFAAPPTPETAPLLRRVKIKWFCSFLLAVAGTDKLTLRQKLRHVQQARRAETFTTPPACLCLLAGYLYNFKKLLSGLTFRQLLFLGLPFSLFFAYHPVISLGYASGTNLELSVTILYFALFAALHLPRLLKFRLPAPLYFLLAYLWSSCIWSLNPLRGVLTAGLATLLLYTIIAASFYRDLLDQFRRALITAAVLFSLYGLIQFALATSNINLTMCAGCTADIIGYPRITGLLIEPQFFGSLLVLAFLLARRFPAQLLIALAVILTMSRGALLALVLGTATLIIFQRRQFFRPLLRYAAVGLVSLVLGLTAIGFATSFHPQLTFLDGVSRATEQLTLGRIRLVEPAATADQSLKTAPEAGKPSEKHTSPMADNAREGVSPSNGALYAIPEESLYQGGSDAVSEEVRSGELADKPADQSTVFDGYIAESTNIRLDLTRAALEAWQETPMTMVFGTGLGSAGAAMSTAGADNPDLIQNQSVRIRLRLGLAEIVQNQYVETLLELGLIGLALSVGLLIYIWRRHPLQATTAALVVAAAVQIFFFSGLPNALHVYLIVALFSLTSSRSQPLSSSRPRPSSAQSSRRA